MSINSLIERGLTYLLEPGVEKAVKRIKRNLEAAPTCCDTPMEYLGEHSSHFLNTQFYQCQVCKRLELLHKQDWEK